MNKKATKINKAQIKPRNPHYRLMWRERTFTDHSKYSRKGKKTNGRCNQCWETLEDCLCDEYEQITQ